MNARALYRRQHMRGLRSIQKPDAPDPVPGDWAVHRVVESGGNSCAAAGNLLGSGGIESTL